jgi:hypothetical protein
MPVTVIASIFTMSLALAGCGGEPQSTTTATPAITIPAASPSAVAAEDVCAVLTADEINQVLGTQFAEGDKETDDAREIVTCKYTMTDSSTGVELPVAIVNVGVSLIDGQESYDTNLDLALAYFGNEPETTEVPGTSQAYIVTNAETDSPVIGLLVGDRFVQIQIGVEGATNDEATQLAAMAAARSA